MNIIIWNTLFAKISSRENYVLYSTRSSRRHRCISISRSIGCQPKSVHFKKQKRVVGFCEVYNMFWLVYCRPNVASGSYSDMFVYGKSNYNVVLHIHCPTKGGKTLISETILENNMDAFSMSQPIGVNRPAIVREIPHFGFFPAFPHFCENVPHFWHNFENRTNFRCTETFSSKNLCENVNDSVT